MAKPKKLDCSREEAAMTFNITTAKFVETAKREVGKVCLT